MASDAELIDKVKQINNDFFTRLAQMRQSTDYSLYRRFIHSYVLDAENARMLLDLVRDAELNGTPLHNDVEFWEFSNPIIDEEYITKKASFTDERIRAGFMG